MSSKSELNNSLELIAKSSLIVFLSILFSKIFTYVYRIIIARQFGPEVYGLFSLALMLVGWFSIIAIFGLSEGLLRYISIFRGKNEQEKIQSLFRKSFIFLFITGIFLGALLFIFAGFISNEIFNEPDLALFLKLFSIVIPLGVLLTALLSSLRAYEKVGWHSFLSHILMTISQVGFILLFVLSGLSVIAVPLSYLLGSFVVFIVALIVLKKQVPNIFRKPVIEKSRDTFKEVFSYSWPLLFAGIIWRIFEWTDSFFIGIFKNATDVGVYNAAVPIAMLLLVSSQIFMQLFYPLINKEYSKGNKEGVKQMSKQVGKWILIINLPVIILLITFPGVFLNLLFGEAYLEATGALRILAIGFFFISLLGISNRLISMTGRSKILFLDIIVVATINVILNIILIPRYGLTGAAIATSVSFGLISVISASQAYYYLKIIPIRRKMFNIVISGLISFGALLYLKAIVPSSISSLIILAVFFLTLYLFLVYIFKGFDKNDIMVFRSLLRRVKE